MTILVIYLKRNRIFDTKFRESTKLIIEILKRILIFEPKFHLSTKLFVGLEQKNVGLAWNILG